MGMDISLTNIQSLLKKYDANKDGNFTREEVADAGANSKIGSQEYQLLYILAAGGKPTQGKAYGDGVFVGNNAKGINADTLSAIAAKDGKGDRFSGEDLKAYFGNRANPTSVDNQQSFKTLNDLSGKHYLEDAKTQVDQQFPDVTGQVIQLVLEGLQQGFQAMGVILNIMGSMMGQGGQMPGYQNPGINGNPNGIGNTPDPNSPEAQGPCNQNNGAEESQGKHRHRHDSGQGHDNGGQGDGDGGGDHGGRCHD